MKNIILATALLLGASVSQAMHPAFVLKCTSPEASTSPTANGEPVSLQVAQKVKFARNCGRCPTPIDPIEPEEPTPTTYFAKLTVGDQVYHFVCQ